jgi:hypothetical protein
MNERKPKVFISYSWDSKEHEKKVLSFTDSLREHGIDCIIDKFKDYTDENNEDWKAWIDKHLIESDVTLVICTKNYNNCFNGHIDCMGKGGVKWEADLIRTLIQQKRKIVPIIFSSEDEDYIPMRLDGKSRYQITDYDISDIESSYYSLYSNITNQHIIKPRELGTLLKLSDSTSKMKSSSEMQEFKETIKNINIRFLKKIVFKYLPITYRNEFPNTVEEIFDKLLDIGLLADGHSVPILSVLRNLNEDNYHQHILNLIDFLKKEQYSDVDELEATIFSEGNEVSLLVRFSEEARKYNITIWQYENNEFYQLNIFNEKIDLKDMCQVQSLLSNIHKHIQTNIEDIFGDNIFIELILPSEELLQEYKSWIVLENDPLLRRYKVIFRLESRFSKPNEKWISKWHQLVEKKHENFAANSYSLDKEKYENELAGNVNSVIVKRTLNNLSSFINDIIEFGIPVVLLPLLEQYTDEFEKVYQKTSIEACRKNIADHVMTFHDSEDSEILLIYDNPNLIPNEVKEPSCNLYGY